LWLKENNLLYYDFSDFNAINDSENSTGNDAESCITTEVNMVMNNGHESGTIPVDYSVPDIEIDTFLCKTPTFEVPIQFDKPTWLSQIPHGEELAFPWLFPLGKGGIYESRVKKMSVLEYFHHRLYNRDSRWRMNITYLICMLLIIWNRLGCQTKLKSRCT